MQQIDLIDRTWDWIRESDPEVEGSRVSWTCEGGTDFWRLTSSGVVAHNGHACLVEVEGGFSLRGEFSANLAAQYDQVGLIAIKSPTEWFKGGVELDGQLFVGGVFTRETSDWSISPGSLPAGLILTRKSGTVELSWRPSGGNWTLLRQFTFEGVVNVGFYSASPLGEGFRATVQGLNLSLTG